jgi:hypothetical protein
MKTLALMRKVVRWDPFWVFTWIVLLQVAAGITLFGKWGALGHQVHQSVINWTTFYESIVAFTAHTLERVL